MESTSPASRGAVDRPIVGLDVDGVIALAEPPAVEARAWDVSAWGRWTRSIRVPAVAPGVIAQLGDEADLVWISAWGHNAPTSLRHALGLDAAQTAFLPVQFGKAEALADYADERPWALIHDGTAHERTTAPNGLVVQVDPRRGLAEVDPGALLQTLRGRGASQQGHHQLDGGPNGR